MESSKTTKEEVKTTSGSPFSSFNNPKSLIFLLIGAFAVLAIITTFFINARNNDQGKDNPNTQEEEFVFEPIAPNDVVYGFWGNDTSHINALDLTSGEIRELAILPANIKKVTITSPSSMVFINNTDLRDHGTEIASFDSGSKLTTPLVTASQGFGIDDYVISPNKRYIAIWEVSIPEFQNLDKGRSRVYSVDLQNPGTKNLIYDETIEETIFATYPLAITDSGEIYLDTFQPNTSAGWANGMFVSDFAGINKQEIETMRAGSYATQPKLSPDGRYLAFAGYDGTRGAGTAMVGSQDGFRQAILSPNTIEILDVTTKERTKLAGLANTNRYPDVKWDRTGKVFYSMVSRDIAQNGYYTYDLATSTPTKVFDTGDIAQVDTYSPVTSLSNGKYLAGQIDVSPSSLGNLGSTYSQSISEFGVFDSAGTLTPLAIDQGLMQYIDVFDSNYFAGGNVVGQAGIGSERASTDQLQLQSFVIKPTLEPARTTQQSTGRCRDVAAAQCNSMLGTNISGDDARAGNTGNAEFDACFQQEWKNAKAASCSDSPLYLYGNAGTKVSVEIGTEVSNSNAPYSGAYKGTLTGDGGIKINGSSYSSLDFNYINALRKLPRLEYGTTVNADEVGNVIRDYGKRLGLNDIEINDTIKKIGEIESKYVFVSFFDDKTSKNILPMTISPTPDVYRNVVFYLKPTNTVIVAGEPQFETFKRYGFTAVEVSFMIDR